MKQAIGAVGAGLLVSVLVNGSVVLGAPLPAIASADALSRPGPVERGHDSDAAKLLGTTAPAFPALPWLDGRLRTLGTLAGHVVVVRSFTNECPYCAATMPTLQRLHERYRDRGVIVLGVYHPKPPAATDSEDIAEFAESLGVTFPVAVDEDWLLVKRWWRDRSEGPWTSITWILDDTGKIRYVHPGGEYHDSGSEAGHERCRSDAREIASVVESLLSPPSSPNEKLAH